ncbi:DUF4306 domain-containing protein [Pontibacillus yanchengensis]|uniref:DUF4306 domain-containing protein n=1 Tax=Pontibacillus yanchengensis Y32 TaxID=1385514 RepID=A0A0A2T6K5_9BACI|nr:DUF4306 domain-containing protein [Pontibacillus yanchengensis]KGP71139.1 hypothetical protein N782_21640 [Pontibacillus yanchengensis Y32]
MKYGVQYMCVCLFLVFTVMASWYEGSALRGNPWEWEYSAVLSKLVNGEISTKSDIVQLDHFVYAAKFKPLFPLLMTSCLIYLVTLLMYTFARGEIQILRSFHIVMASFCLVLSMVMFQSVTIGGTLFAGLFLFISFVQIVVLTSLQMKKNVTT